MDRSRTASSARSTTTWARSTTSRWAATLPGSRKHCGIRQSPLAFHDRGEHFPGNGVLIGRGIEHQLEKDRSLELLDVVDDGAPLGTPHLPGGTDPPRGKHLDAQRHIADLSIPHCACLWFFQHHPPGKERARASAHSITAKTTSAMRLMRGNARSGPRKERVTKTDSGLARP